MCARRAIGWLAVMSILLAGFATPVAADTYAPSYCEFSIAPDATAERRSVRDQYGEAEVAEYYGDKSALKAQCARFLGVPLTEEQLARYMAYVQKASGIKYSGWSTHETSAGRAVSLKGTKSQGRELWKVWMLGLRGEKSFLVVTVMERAEDFVSDFAWDALGTLRLK
jgi:hypothetical protein